jgi:hypothetical protein
VRTVITTPGFETPSGFDANRLHVYAYIVDYYFRKGFKGWWVGPGFETWHGEVQQRGGAAKRTYQTDILTLGAGYTFRFNDHLYVNPWAALLNGSAATSSVGTLLEVGDVLPIVGHDVLVNFSAIRTTGTSGQLDCTYYVVGAR